MKANISLSKKFIFIHISKCAGMSITEILNPYIEEIEHNNILWKNANNHSKYSEFESLLKEKIKKYFVFSFVRNPFDRTISLYHHWRKSKATNADNICIDGLNITEATWKLKDFNEWVHFINQNYASRHMEPQLTWLNNNNNNIPSNLYVGKVENINEDIKFILNKLNIKITNIPKINITEHNHYKDEYDSKSIEIITKRFKEDLDYFNYSFN